MVAEKDLQLQRSVGRGRRCCALCGGRIGDGVSQYVGSRRAMSGNIMPGCAVTGYVMSGGGVSGGGVSVSGYGFRRNRGPARQHDGENRQTRRGNGVP